MVEEEDTAPAIGGSEGIEREEPPLPLSIALGWERVVVVVCGLVGG